MTADNTSTTFGITIEHKPASHIRDADDEADDALLPTNPSFVFPQSPPHPTTSPPNTGGKNAKSNTANPFSAFYTHRSSRQSLEQLHTESPLQTQTHLPMASDLEAGQPPKPAPSPAPQHSRGASGNKLSKGGVDATVRQDLSMWPTRQTLEENAQNEKQARHRREWRGLGCGYLTKRQKLWVKILIALIVVAAAVGIGVGISLAVGGEVYESQGQSKAIPKIPSDNDG